MAANRDFPLKPARPDTPTLRSLRHLPIKGRIAEMIGSSRAGIAIAFLQSSRLTDRFRLFRPCRLPSPNLSARKVGMAFAVGAVSLLTACHCADLGPYSFGAYEFDQHRLDGPIVLSSADGTGLLASGTSIEVVVDRFGAVRKATPVGIWGDKALAAKAVSAAHALHFRPFTFAGRAVEALGTVDVKRHYSGDDYPWRGKGDHFPPIDPNDLTIQLKRSACLGECTPYSVELHGDGHGVFEAVDAPSPGSEALIPGRHTFTVSLVEVRSLVAALRKARFFDLPHHLGAGNDSPLFILSFATGGQRTTVTEQSGFSGDELAFLHRLQDRVDEVASSRRWLEGDAHTVDWLAENGISTASPQAAALAPKAMKWGRDDGPDRFVLTLIARGMPLEQAVSLPDGERLPLGAALLLKAAKTQRAQVAIRLVALGWQRRLDRSQLTRALVGGAACDPDVAAALYKAGAALRTAIGDSALTTSCETRDRIVMRLVSLGADPNVANGDGWTALHNSDDEELTRFLIRHSANVNARTSDGDTPLTLADSDVEALPLLEAGADPSLYGADGKSFLDLVANKQMPATQRWLAAHGYRLRH